MPPSRESGEAFRDADPPLLSIRHLRKSFGGVPVLSDVGIELHRGEVHALMGENGAGKSTLIRILAGVTRADSVEARLDGRVVALGTPAAAERAGFRFVHQELNVVPTLTVAENIFLGQPMPRRLGAAVDWRQLQASAAAALARFGVGHIDPRAKVARLGVGDRMLIRLAALLVAGGTAPALFVLDEPTAALTAGEADRLFRVIGELTAAGAAILYVSHRLDEIMALADRVTVLRDGMVALANPRADLDRAALIRAMIGRDVAESHPARPARLPGRVVCRLDGVASGRLSGLSFEVREGEVLGVVGLENAGQSEVLRLLLGDHGRATGRGEVAGGPLPRSPAEAWRRGTAFVPRERRREGLMLGRGITANAALPHLARLCRHGVALPRREAAEARRVADRLRLRCRRLSQAVRTLSGGNQQKVVLARATLAAPRLLLLDEPTRGVDVGARQDIYAALRDLTAEGAAIVLASTDLPEVLGLSDRVLILREGRQVGLVEAAGLEPAALLSLIYGDGAPSRAP